MTHALELQVWPLLSKLELLLKSLSCWDEKPPELSLLDSKVPFCADTLEFYQWLQWIFIPRVRSMSKEGVIFSGVCSVRPMAEVWFQTRCAGSGKEVDVVLLTLERLDNLLSAPLLQ